MSKVLIINSVIGIGSTGKIVQDLMDEYQRQGFDVYFAYGRSSKVHDNVEKRGFKIGSKFSVLFHVIMSRLFDLHGLCSVVATKKLIKQFYAVKPDRIDLYNLHGYYLNYKKLFEYLKKTHIKIVWTLHDAWAFTGHCAYFGNCFKWKDKCYHCAKKSSYPCSWILDNSSRQYDLKKEAFTGVKDMVLVTPSEWLKNLVKQSYLKEYEVKVINNGINLDNFAHIDEHTFDNVVDRSKKILLGVAMPFTERKGYSDFLKLNDIIDREQYQIVLVGLNEDQIAHLPEGMVGIKRTDNQKQLAELYSIAYAFVNFTYEDTFSMVNIEALACGTPVICYNTGGAVEMLNAQNAIVMKQGAYAELPKYLDAIGLLREKSESNAKLIKIKYSAANMANGYKEIYNRIYRNEL